MNRSHFTNKFVICFSILKLVPCSSYLDFKLLTISVNSKFKHLKLFRPTNMIRRKRHCGYLLFSVFRPAKMIRCKKHCGYPLFLFPFLMDQIFSWIKLQKLSQTDKDHSQNISTTEHGMHKWEQPQIVEKAGRKRETSVASRRSANIPASTHTAFNWAPLKSSVDRANSSKLTSGWTFIFLEWICNSNRESKETKNIEELVS